MRCLNLILLCSFFARLECVDYSWRKDLTSFFITRLDTKEAICTVENFVHYQHVTPTFDLDKLKFPPNVGNMHWDWLSGWQLQTDIQLGYRGSFTQMMIAGDYPYQLVSRRTADVIPEDIMSPDLYILASNVSLWMPNENSTHSRGILIEIDHWNETTRMKDTAVKYCDKMPEETGANCTIVDYKNGTNHLSDGNRWKQFYQIAPIYKKNHTIIELIKIMYQEEKWYNINISELNISGYFAIYAKSHQRNAALSTYDNLEAADLTNNNEMKRNLTHRNSGKFCFNAVWNKISSNDPHELLEMKNLVSGRVELGLNTTHQVGRSGRYGIAYYQWNNLPAGEYQITLRFNRRQPVLMELCSALNSTVVRTWINIPRMITNCQFDIGGPFEYSVGPSSTWDPKLKPNWNLDDWVYVCDRLGIGSNDTAVPIKFCNSMGCNFSECPHLKDI